MRKDFLNRIGITSQAAFVEYGYGQVEPNHLSAQRNGKIYAQLPAAEDITVLEQGQFVKYNYAKGLVTFAEESSETPGTYVDEGEWFLVFNEIKLYREDQQDCEFAMVKSNYNARVYSPVSDDGNLNAQSRYYNGKDYAGNTSITIGQKTYNFDKVTTPASPYDTDSTDDPFHIWSKNVEKMMPEGTKMVPRVFKTDVGDIFTTNMIDEDAEDLAVGDVLKVRAADGILCKDGDSDMEWTIVRIYTMPDGQAGCKLQRTK